MIKHQTRRQFIKGTVIGSTSCCTFLMNCSKNNETVTNKQAIDYRQLSYCGLECATCDLYKATQANNVDEKKRLAKEWFNVDEKDFKADEIFCHTCKTEDKPHNQFQKGCLVRACAKEKKLLTCAHCNELPTCDKEFWTKWPKVKEKIDGMQQELLKTNAA